MDANHLYYFRMVAEEGSFNKAADKLFITRQGLSKAIHKLEEELGTELFTITPKGVLLTRIGELLYENSKSYIDFHQDFIRQLTTMDDTLSDELRLGIQYGFSEGIRKNHLFDFIQTHPEIDTRIYSYPRDHIREAMQNKDIPIWIVTGAYDKQEFRSIYTKTSKMNILVSTQHPLVQKNQVRLSDIMEYKLIELPHDIGQKGIMNSFIDNDKIKHANYYLSATDFGLMMELIRHGLAIAFNASWRYQQYQDIKAIYLEDFDFGVDVHVLLRKNTKMTKSIQSFVRYVKTQSHTKEVTY